MCLHLKLLDIDHPLTFEVRKLRQIETHALTYLSTENFETLTGCIMWHYHFESPYTPSI